MAPAQLSLLIPSFNHARFVREALESAFAQTRRPDEIVVVDDGSTDGTAELLRRYADRVRVLLRPHRGIGETYNDAVEQARGDWIAFLESDDALEPTYLEECVGFLENAPRFAWVSTARRIVDREGRPTGVVAGKRTSGEEFTTAGFLLRDLGTSWTPVVRREALLRVGPFVTGTHVADAEMALRFSLHFPMGYLRRPLYLHRRHGANASGAALRDTRELLRMLREFREREVEFVRRNDGAVRRGLAKLCGRVASLMLGGAERPSRGEVLALLAEAVRNDPTRLRHLRRWLTVALLGTRIPGNVKRHLGRRRLP